MATYNPNQNKPIIAVLNGWGSIESALESVGAEVLSIDSLQDAYRALKYADAMLLTGGGDIAPSRYGAQRHSEVYGMDQQRDKLEFSAVKAARRKGIPIMGICRGHQLLNIAHGGSLLQHIDDLKYAQSHEGTSHWIKLRKKSRIGKALSTVAIQGTSLHHQAIDRLGDGLLPVGWAPDGTIEMMESAPGIKPYILGVQFHPEMDYKLDQDAQGIFEFFISIARQRSHELGNYAKRLAKVTDLLAWNAYQQDNSRGGLLGYGSDYGQWWDDEIKEYEHVKNLNLARDNIDCEIEDIEDCTFPPCRSPRECEVNGDCFAEVMARKDAAMREHHYHGVSIDSLAMGFDETD